MPGGVLFDRVVVVDWSAASVPTQGRDSIWVATVDGDGCTLENPPTRALAEDRIRALADPAARTLLGVDFSLGYPAGTAAALGLTGTPWRAMWAWLETAIADDRRNHNNRFLVAAELNGRLGAGTGPFWGRPPRLVVDSLSPTKAPRHGLPEWRAVERALRAGGHHPFSSWQLFGAGCVGSQSLVGIPVLERLCRDLGRRAHVWPFTSGLTVPDVAEGDVVVAEVWPSMFERSPDAPAPAVKDAGQVEATAEHLADLDRRGRLGSSFAPTVTPGSARSIVAEEGWILGVRGAALDAPGEAPAAMAGAGS